MSFDNGPELPVFLASRGGLSGPVDAAISAETIKLVREHCRLLYVALTRAEDLLYVAGTLRGVATEAHPESWYAACARAMDALGAETIDLAGWATPAIEWRSGEARRRVAVNAPTIVPDDATTLPLWATTPPSAEARPARPLSPSAFAADDVASPPVGPAARVAAARGQAMHALFERLPGIAAADRSRVGKAWVAANHAGLDAAAVTANVIAILDDPAFADVFAADALAEAPLAATVGDIVVAGTVDRLLIGASHVRVVDFKTGRFVPASAEDVPIYYLRQMAAYVAALRVVFPGRTVEAALLFTHGPALIPLPDAVLALYPVKREPVLNEGDDTPILPTQQRTFQWPTSTLPLPL